MDLPSAKTWVPELLGLISIYSIENVDVKRDSVGEELETTIEIVFLNMLKSISGRGADTAMGS